MLGKKGQIVNIWQDPFTLNEFEGKAKLIEFIRSVVGFNKAEEWWVQFCDDDEGEEYPRTVNFT